MITVHHLEESRSLRVLWLLEELGLDYEVRHYKRDPVTRLGPPELRAIHALGKSPILVDDNAVMAETGAIVEYLIDKYGEGRLRPPPASPQRLRYTYWLHYAEGSAMPPLLIGLVTGRLGEAARPAMPFVSAQIKLHFGYIDGELAKSQWFAGEDLSGADIMMSFPLERAAQLKDASERPHILDFVGRIRSRDAYIRAMARGEGDG
ncbi:MAG TPA: glutathione S-transferase [Roseiarcus sp.]|jgi:glutathione S-transferase|nr:glutathione S-transferase [Roseiarcus sp.]